MRKIVLIVISGGFLIAISVYLLITPREERIVSIAYTTDLQGFISPRVEYGYERKSLLGGSAYLAAYIKKERKSAERENRGFFLLDTGNFFSGQAEGYLLKGSSIIDIMNNLGYDALVIGPKDFTFGEENLRRLAKEAKFPFLGANIIKEDTDEIIDYVRPYIIKEYKGIKIGIIGITTPVVFTENIKGLKILNPFETARKYVSILNKAGIDLIIVLSNLGLEEDKRLAQEVKDINVIIGGNDRQGYRDLWPFYIDPKNKTVIVCTCEKGMDGYRIDSILDRHGKVLKYKSKLKELRAVEIKPILKIQTIVQKYTEIVQEKKKEVIGYAQTGFRNLRDKESALGNWVADILRQKTKADIALIAGLQADLKQGEVTLGDVYNILPIIDRLEVVGFNLAILELTGEQIKEMLGIGVSYGLEKAGGVLQVSGLRYAYDLKRKKEDSVVEIEVGDEKLVLSRTYRVAVNSYLAAGLGGYYMVKDAKKRYDTGLMDFDVLVQYIKEHSPISPPPLEGKITKIE